MKLTIDIQGLREAQALIAGFSDRRMNAAVATGLTRTAVQARAAVVDALPRAFDRPTPYTLKSVKYVAATAARLTAHVGIDIEAVRDLYGNVSSYRGGEDTPASKYLQPQIEGGQRRIKRMELALQARAAMPKGWMAVPARGARLDAYGNVSRGQVAQIISQLGAVLLHGDTSKLRRRPGESDKAWATRRRNAYGKAGGQYVAIPKPRGKLKPGIYLAEGRNFGAKLGYGRNGKLVPVFIFVPSTRYKPRFDFYGIVQRVADAHLQANIEQAVGEHIDSLAAAQKGA
jgi:hypothetical protein